MRGIMIIASGYEDMEVVTTLDVLALAGLVVYTVAARPDTRVVSQLGIATETQMSLKDVAAEEFDFMIIPGGAKAVEHLHLMPKISHLILDFTLQKKLVAAICAGPSVVAKLGLYNTFTCYPGWERYAISGEYAGDKKVVVDRTFITAKARYYALDFALAIVEYLLGAKAKRAVVKKMQGKN